VRQLREECRVVQGQLMHRLQSVDISRKCSTAMPSRHNLPSEMICPHVNFRKSVHNIGVKRCQECCTDYRIDFKHYDGHGWALFFTRWKNLGAGPESEVWRQHLLPRPASPIWSQTSVGLQTQVEDQPEDEDLPTAFGDSDAFKFDSLLTSRNKADLFRFKEQCWREVKYLCKSDEPSNQESMSREFALG
jgi:hypothetical protein